MWRQSFTEAPPMITRVTLVGDTAGALADYNRAIEIDPNYVQAYVDRATIYESEGDYNRALNDLDQAIQINPNFEPAYRNRSNDYNRTGNFAKGLEDGEHAVQLAPT